MLLNKDGDGYSGKADAGGSLHRKVPLGLNLDSITSSLQEHEQFLHPARHLFSRLHNGEVLAWVRRSPRSLPILALV